MKKIITIYFSRKGLNYFNGNIVNLAKGNTHTVAEFIQKAVGGDIFEIETITPYAADYYECTDQAKKELLSSARPELKRYPPDLNGYDIIFIGYPNWWGTMPMPLFTLLEKYDLKDKVIIPFCTHEGSGMGSSERDLAKLCQNSTVAHPLPIQGAKAAQSEKQVAQWAKRSIQ